MLGFVVDLYLPGLLGFLSVPCFWGHSCTAYVGSTTPCHSAEMNQIFSWLLPQNSNLMSCRNVFDKIDKHIATMNSYITA